MKKCLFYAIFLISSCQSNHEIKASNSECEKFKKGEFFHTAQGDPTIYKIKRSDSIQTEFIGKTGDYVNLRIEWISPCSYVLTFLNQHIVSTDSISNPAELKKVKVDILTISGDSCYIIADNGIERLPGVVYRDRR